MDDQTAVFNAYFQALCELNLTEAEAIIAEALQMEIRPEDLLLQIVIPSFEQLNEALVVNQEINLAQHYLSAKISEAIAMELLGKFTVSCECPGCVIMGTAVGDFHGLGKKIVIGCLRAHMFRVIDAGTNVTAEQFVDQALENNAQVIGISSMMAHTATGPNGPKGVRKILQERGLESRIKLMVGGAPYRFDHELYRKVQADGWGLNGLVAVETARRLIAEIEK